MNAILKNWWILTIKGVITFILGIIAITMNIGAMIIVARIFGVLLILCGLTLLYLTIRDAGNNRDREWKLTEGFIDLIIGLIMVSFSSLTPDIFLMFIAIWISFMGILQISNGYRLRGLYNHYWILIFNGFLAIGFAVIIFTQPVQSLITMMILIGLQTIVFGGFLIISSLYIRKIFRDIKNEIPQKAGEDANQELSYY